MNRPLVLALLTIAAVVQADKPPSRAPAAVWTSAEAGIEGVRAIDSFAPGCPSASCSAPSPDLLKGRGRGVVVKTSEQYYPEASGAKRSFVVSIQVSNPDGQCSWRIGQGFDVQVDGKWRRTLSIAITALLTPEKGKAAVLVHAIPGPTPKGESALDGPATYLLDGIPACHLFKLPIEKDLPRWQEDGALQVPATRYMSAQVYRRP